MASLYDELGVHPDATPDELHRAYRDRARLLHPDRQVNPGASELAGAQEAMARLNRAWAVLGDPEARRRYDAEQRSSYDDRDEDEWWEGPRAEDGGFPHHSRRWLAGGPAALLIIVMFLIFVFSAYAGPPAVPPATGPVPTTTPPTTSPGLGLLGQCLAQQPGTNVVTACSQPNSGRVVAVPGSGQGCPSGTTARLVVGQTQVVCLDPRAAIASGQP